MSECPHKWSVLPRAQWATVACASWDATSRGIATLVSIARATDSLNAAPRR